MSSSKLKRIIISVLAAFLMLISVGITVVAHAATSEAVIFDGSFDSLTFYDNGVQGASPTVNRTHTGSGVSISYDNTKHGNVQTYELKTPIDMSGMTAPCLDMWFYFRIEDPDAYYDFTRGDFNFIIALFNKKYMDLSRGAALMDNAGNKIMFKERRNQIADNAWTHVRVPLFDRTFATDGWGLWNDDINFKQETLDAIAIRSYNTNGTGLPDAYFSSMKIVDLGSYSNASQYGTLETVFEPQVVAAVDGVGGIVRGGDIQADNSAVVQVMPDPGYKLKSVRTKTGTDSAPVLAPMENGNGYAYTLTNVNDLLNTNQKAEVTFQFEPLTSATEETGRPVPTGYTMWNSPSAVAPAPLAAESGAVQFGVFRHAADNYENWYNFAASQDVASVVAGKGLNVSNIKNLAVAMWLYIPKIETLNNFTVSLASDYMRFDDNVPEIEAVKNGQKYGVITWDLKGLDLKKGWNKLCLPVNGEAGTIKKNGINFQNITTLIFSLQKQSTTNEFYEISSLEFVSTDARLTSAQIMQVESAVAVTKHVTGNGTVSATDARVGQNATLSFVPFPGGSLESAFVSYAGGTTVQIKNASTDNTTAGINGARVFELENVLSNYTVTAVFKGGSAEGTESVPLNFRNQVIWSTITDWTLSDLYHPGLKGGNSVRIFNGHQSKDSNQWFGIGKTDLSQAGVNALEVWVYYEDLSKINGDAFIRLVSGMTIPSSESDYNNAFNRKSINWTVPKSMLTNGWNRIVLPILDGDMRAEFDLSDVRVFTYQSNSLNYAVSIVAIDSVRMIATANESVSVDRYPHFDYSNFLYDGEGFLYYSGCRNGCLTVGTEAVFTASPDAGYRVAAIRKNDKFGEMISHNDGVFRYTIGDGEKIYVEFAEIPLRSVSIDGGDRAVSSYYDGKFTLTFTVEEVGADNFFTVKWESSNSEIVSVDPYGKVKVLKDTSAEGVTITLTVTKNGNNYTDSIVVKASGMPVFTGIELGASELHLKLGETYDMPIEKLGQNVDGILSIDTSSTTDRSVAESSNGKITAKGIGVATITYSVNIDGVVHSASVAVTVSENGPEQPNTPDNPDNPNTPDTPNTPDDPDNPNIPDNPDDGNPPSSKKDGSSLGIVLGVIGCVVIVAGVAAFVLFRRKKNGGK